ncbi:MAG: sulfate adenylyltransferase subunit CysN [Betaproteobacteria bacterium]|nr:sulfate adenylyltransferase subunit CysN [Betaproteobacteria bacterium]
MDQHLPTQQHTELLRFITCGSVDDGKSTLIGRLLFDSKAIFEDQLAAISATSQRRGMSETDLALLTDGLQAEREQGITIDVAYRYFSTPKRRFIIADTPGHEQYTRNMVTGASTADVAIILMDVRKGVLTQTRRHTHIVRLLGIRQIILAINKMDLVDFDEQTFNQVHQEFLTFANALGFDDIIAVPMSALQGDMVVDRGTSMPWYQGHTLIDVLESVKVDENIQHAPFRFPVQLVHRVRNSGELNERRLYLGRVESGHVSVGDEVVVLPAGVNTTVASIDTYDGALKSATAGQSVTITLSEQVDISRGDMIAQKSHSPRTEKSFSALICWLSNAELDVSKRLLLRHGTQTVAAKIAALEYKLDINHSIHVPTEKMAMNDIVKVLVRVQQPINIDNYESNRPNGSFIIIDELTNDTVAAGMVVEN